MFLPRILLLLWIVAHLLASCGGPEPRNTQQAPGDLVQVAVGTGDVEPGVVAGVRAMVVKELPDLRRTFGNLDLERFFVHVHASRESMPDSLVGGLSEGVPGFAVLGRHQIHLIWSEIRGGGASLRGVVRHELVHELLDQYVAPEGRHLPRWFHEGLAQFLAGDTYLDAREDDLFWRVGSGSLFAFSQLHERFPTGRARLQKAYAQSFSYVSWLVRNYGMSTLLRVARYADALTSFGRALAAQTDRSTMWLEDRWRDYLTNGSGARWRILFDNWFSLLLVAVLPVLVIAMIRRLSKEERARRLLTQREQQRAAEVERMQLEEQREQERQRLLLLQADLPLHGPPLRRLELDSDTLPEPPGESPPFSPPSPSPPTPSPPSLPRTPPPTDEGSAQ
ncbi:MAG: hypothetical protein AB8H80_03900 [Planctomycetota bacterium]